MEFSFNVNAFLKDEITVIDKHHEALRFGYLRNPAANNANRDSLREVINKLGERSATAQGLNGSITSFEQLLGGEQRCYVLKDTETTKPNGVVLGLLKVGSKKLFFLNGELNQVEVTPLCVLDFYVHESCQRRGHGFRLFSHMIQREGVAPGALAIDRPSDKMLSFYKKRFSLSAPIKQPNNFVVFRDFFKCYVPTSNKRWPDQHNRGPIKLKAVDRPGSGRKKVAPVDPLSGGPPDSKPTREWAVGGPVKATVPLAAATSQPPKQPTTSDAPLVLPSVLDRPLSRLVSSPSSTKLNSPPRLVASRDRTFSWSRNNVSTNYNYVVGGNNLPGGRYTHFNRPRPF